MKYFREQKNCRLCSTNDLVLRISLPPLSITSPNIGKGIIGNDVVAPLNVYQCNHCGFLQLSVVINSEYQYRDFLYTTNLSLGLTQHFADLMEYLSNLKVLHKDALVVDVGSNDGSLLKLAKNRGCKVVGIDPAIEIAKKATAQGIPTYGDFFTEEKAKEIRAQHGKADIIISNNTIANIDNLVDVFSGFLQLLHPNGVLVIETQYALDVLQEKLLDVIYHEHISYFLVGPMQLFLKKIGFELISAERISPKGGSIRFIAQISGAYLPVSPEVHKLIALERSYGLYDMKIFNEFNQFVKQTGDKLMERLISIRKKYGYAFGYGSSVGCSALMHYFALEHAIDVVFDDHPLHNSINVNKKQIPVAQGNQLIDYSPSEIAVFAWRYIDHIRQGQKNYINRGGDFFPVLRSQQQG